MTVQEMVDIIQRGAIYSDDGRHSFSPIPHADYQRIVSRDDNFYSCTVEKSPFFEGNSQECFVVVKDFSLYFMTSASYYSRLREQWLCYNACVQYIIKDVNESHDYLPTLHDSSKFIFDLLAQNTVLKNTIYNQL